MTHDTSRTCGFDSCPRNPDWDIYALNTYDHLGRVSATCTAHLGPRLQEYYEACDLEQRILWATVVPFNPNFDDDYEREDRDELALV